MKQSYIPTISVNSNNGENGATKKVITSSMIENLSDVIPVESAYVVADTTTSIFSNVYSAIGDIADDNVRKQVIGVLKQMSMALHRVTPIPRRFRKLSAVQNDDGSFLVEWHFSGFHIGLSFEPLESDSYYFLVSIDESIGETDARTRRINGDAEIIVNEIMQYVINNA